ncbi:hypothetical protein DAI22_09g059100 [Oryza sativa Japonica Group]|nr:hypothetical protein DAI22_09g059100 [Oryza sativa Japonica Group]KAF2915703.1 hypothetical protein DAI22_09g059100 [Oryza sativa Japonica Group]
MAGSGVVTSSTTVSDLAINCTIDRNVTPNESFGEGEEVLLILLVLTRQSPLSSARLQPQLHILLTAKVFNIMNPMLGSKINDYVLV